MVFTLSKYVQLQDLLLRDYQSLASPQIAASPASFGLSSAIATQITNATAAFDNAISALDANEVAYRASVQTKKVARENLLNLLVQYYPMAYANPTVTDATLATIYLAPRSERRGFVMPTQPLQFAVTTYPNGFAKFKWKRNGNTTSTVFVLEQKIGENEWEMIWSGTRISIDLSGFAPGVEAMFRVYASKGEITSPPSDIVIIYPEGGTDSVQLAA